MNKAIVLDNCKVKKGRVVRVLDKKKQDDVDNVEDETKNIKLVVLVEDAEGNDKALMFTSETFKAAEDLALANEEDIPEID
jgi:hypothetical protein